MKISKIRGLLSRFKIPIKKNFEDNLEQIQNDSEGQNKQWKDLSDFILNQDVQVFRSILS